MTIVGNGRRLVGMLVLWMSFKVRVMASFEKPKTEKQTEITEVCSKCGKQITPAERKLSFTAYLFKENRCKCAVSSRSSVQTGIEAESNVARNKQTALEQPDFDGRYEVLEFLGEGGMGTVWKVQNQDSFRPLAIKILRSELASDNAAVQRFKQEAELATTLTHPNLVVVYGHGMTNRGAPYLVMDFLEGESLAEVLTREIQLDVPRVLGIALQVGNAIASAHAKGIVHRDLKPSNIILTKNEQGEDSVKIVDFGIAKIMPSINEQTKNLTQTGELFGSPLYMSPEQCLGDSVDARTDVYSLGCILFELLCGTAPFRNSNPVKIILGHINNPVDFGPLRNTNAPERLIDVVSACLIKAPDSRYQSMQEVIDDLEMIQSGKPPVNCHKAHARERKLTEKKKRSKVFFAWFSLAAAVFSLLLIGLAAWSIYVTSGYVKSDLPRVETHAKEGTWRKISEDAQQLLNEGKFKDAKIKLNEAEKLSLNSDKSKELLLTLKKEQMLAQIMSEPALVRKLTIQISTQEQRVRKEQSSEELSLLIAALDSYPNQLSPAQQQKFDSLSRKFLDWGQKLIKARRFEDARNLLEPLTAKFQSIQVKPSMSIQAKLALADLAVAEFRESVYDRQTYEYKHVGTSLKELRALTNEPKSPLLSKEEYYRAMALRAYIEALFALRNDKHNAKRLQAFERCSQETLAYYRGEGAASSFAAESVLCIADGLNYLHRLKDSREIYEQAIELFQASGDIHNINYCYSKIAGALDSEHKPEVARDFLIARLEEANLEQADEMLIADLYSQLGRILWNQNQKRNALDAYLNEAKIKQQVWDPETWEKSNLMERVAGGYYVQAGFDKNAWKQSEPYLVQWRAILQLQLLKMTTKNDIERVQAKLGKVNSMIAVGYMSTNRDDEARHLFEERLAYINSVPETDVIYVDEWFPELAEKYLPANEKKQLIARIDTSAGVARKTLRGIRLAEVLREHGETMGVLGELNRAEPCLEEAADLAEKNFNSSPYYAGRIIHSYVILLSRQNRNQERDALEKHLKELMAGE